MSEKEDLKLKMKEQIENTILAIRHHFDPNNFTTVDRLDREIKNKEFKTLLSFYIERAYRYNYLSDNAYNTDCSFLQTLDEGFCLKFNQLGFIFDFSFVATFDVFSFQKAFDPLITSLCATYLH